MVFSSTHSMDSSLIHISLLQEGQGFTGIGILYVAQRAFGLLDQIGWELRHLVGDNRVHLKLGHDVIHRVAPHLESASLFEALQCFGHSEPSSSIRCVYLYPIRPVSRKRARLTQSVKWDCTRGSGGDGGGWPVFLGTGHQLAVGTDFAGRRLTARGAGMQDGAVVLSHGRTRLLVGLLPGQEPPVEGLFRAGRLAL